LPAILMICCELFAIADAPVASSTRSAIVTSNVTTPVEKPQPRTGLTLWPISDVVEFGVAKLHLYVNGAVPPVVEATN